jgi:hypothetical protein
LRQEIKKEKQYKHRHNNGQDEATHHDLPSQLNPLKRSPKSVQPIPLEIRQVTKKRWP